MRLHILYPKAKPEHNHYQKAKEVLDEIGISYKLSDKPFLDVVAYFEKYKGIKVKSNNQWLSECSKCLATAPWMASSEDTFYEKYIGFLIHKKLLEYNESEHYLHLSYENEKYNSITLESDETFFLKIYECITRENYCDRRMILKISVFHARTLIDFLKQRDKSIVDLLNANPNLSIEILCVGKYAGDVAKEGANNEQLKDAISNGVFELYKLARDRKQQFRIRIVRKNDVDASLRCGILIVENHIEMCQVLYWRYGYERGIYGSYYQVDSKSSLALQANHLFDEAFERAIPAKANLEMVSYCGKMVFGYLQRFSFLCVLLLPGYLISRKEIELEKNVINFLLTVIGIEIAEKIWGTIIKKWIDKI